MGLSGRIEDLGIADIFQILSLGRKSGILWVVSETGERTIVVLKNGLICLAESDMLKEDIVAELIKRQIISSDTLSLAKKLQADVPEKTIIDIVIELDYCERATIEYIARKRIAEIVHQLVHLKEGEFRFMPDITTSDDPLFKRGYMLRKGISVEYLLFESARKDDEMARYGQIFEEEDIETETIDTEEFQNKGLSVLRSMAVELRFPESVQEIYLLVLRFASDIYQRGILFTLKEGLLRGFGQFGLTIERPDAKIREMVLDLKKSRQISEIVKKKIPYMGEVFQDELLDDIITVIGGERPVEIGLFPVVVEDKTVAILYCDWYEYPESRPDTGVLEVFVIQAGLAIEKTLLKGGAL